jgi:hypothetical protein
MVKQLNTFFLILSSILCSYTHKQLPKTQFSVKRQQVITAALGLSRTEHTVYGKTEILNHTYAEIAMAMFYSGLGKHVDAGTVSYDNNILKQGVDKLRQSILYTLTLSGISDEDFPNEIQPGKIWTVTGSTNIKPFSLNSPDVFPSITLQYEEAPVIKRSTGFSLNWGAPVNCDSIRVTLTGMQSGKIEKVLKGNESGCSFIKSELAGLSGNAGSALLLADVAIFITCYKTKTQRLNGVEVFLLNTYIRSFTASLKE